MDYRHKMNEVTSLLLPDIIDVIRALEVDRSQYALDAVGTATRTSQAPR